MSQSASTHPAQKKRSMLPVYATVAALVAGGGYYLVTTWNQENTDDAQLDADVVPMAVRTSGLVLKVNVEENQAVNEGDVLMELDEADQAARVKQAEASLANAQAQVAVAAAQVAIVEANARGGLQSARAALSGSSVGVQSALAQIENAKAGLARAKADQHKAELDLSRAKQLRTANAIAQERLDNAQAAFDAAQAEVHQATAQLAAAQVAKDVAQSRVGEAEGRLGQSTPIEAQIASAHASLKLAEAAAQAAQASLDLQRLQFDYLKVKAPVTGTISRMSAHKGQLLAMGQAIGELVPNQIYVTANFKETQIGKMHPGQGAEIDVDAFPGRKLRGKVVSLSAGTGARFSLLPPDNASGNFVKVVQRVPVRIALDGVPQDLALRAGLSADVTVDVAH